MKDVQLNECIRSILSLDTMQHNFSDLDIDPEKLVEINIKTRFNKALCPYCENKKISKWGRRNGLQRYRCNKCHKTFNSLTGTPLAKLRKKDKWLRFSQCLFEGDSVRKAAEKCGVHWNTCLKWKHRFLKK